MNNRGEVQATVRARADARPGADRGSSAAAYRIAAYTPADRDAVVDLQRYLWRGGKRGNAAYLAWKYRHNPYLDHRYLILAWAGAELVGMVGAFGARWESLAGAQRMLPCLADTVVAPEHRGGPAFTLMIDFLLARLREDGVPWLLDFGDQPAGPAMLMRGWKAIGPWPVATALGESTGSALELPGRCSGLRIRRVAAGSPGLRKEMNDLVACLPRDSRVRHVRELAFSRWRARNPLARYQYLVARAEDGRLEGYVVAHRPRVLKDPGFDLVTLVECEAADDAVWTDLVEAARGLLSAPVIIVWARDLEPRRREALRRAGFRLDEPTGRLTDDLRLPNLLVRATGAPAAAPFDALDVPDAWDLRAVCGRSWR